MEKQLVEIGARIEAIIKRLGISRAELGGSLGVKDGAIGKYIRGVSDPGAVALAKIANFGNVSLDWLITGKEQSARSREAPLDDLLAQVVAQPKVMQKIMDHAREQVREEMTSYRPAQQFSEHELELVENYRASSDEIKDANFEMIKSSATKLRARDGGGSNSTEMKSA